MTTTITPASGQGALFTQQGPGTTPGYSALDDRRSNSGSLQEGVYGTPTLVTAGGVSSVVAADFMATQRAAGASMSVDVNMPAGGFAFVQGDTINGQGLYCVPVHSSNINEVIAGADATNPRIDQIILEVQDNVLDASGGNLARTRVLTGTPTGGATLTNRTGALALPGSALLLADVLVPAASSSVPNSNIRDRRKWARGAYLPLVSGASFAAPSTSYTGLATSSGLLRRLECSGLTVEMYLSVEIIGGASNNHYFFNPFIDGVQMANAEFKQVALATALVTRAFGKWTLTPSAGSHTFEPQYKVDSVVASSNPQGFAYWSIREIVDQSNSNNTVTTG